MPMFNPICGVNRRALESAGRVAGWGIGLPPSGVAVPMDPAGRTGGYIWSTVKGIFGAGFDE